MATTRWLTAEQQAIWRTFLAGHARLMERLEADLRPHGLSLAEYEVLVHLSEAPDRRLRMNELASFSRQSRSRLTHTVARMEADGLVERTTCPGDRRGILARLTEKGYEMVVAAAPDHVEGVQAVFFDVIDNGDLDAIRRAFTAVSDAVAETPQPSQPAP